MPTQARRQRDVRRRERLILDVARHILMTEGYAALSMDRIAERAEYSKGTIYQHFSCKEDVLAGMVSAALVSRHDLVARARGFQGRSRERILAYNYGDELFYERFPEYQYAQEVIRMGTRAQRIPRRRRAEVRRRQQAILGIAREIIHQAVTDGDLELTTEQSEGSITYGLWALTHGIRSLANMRFETEVLGLQDTGRAARQTAECILDGMNWAPLSHHWDYRQTLRRIQGELFATANHAA